MQKYITSLKTAFFFFHKIIYNSIYMYTRILFKNIFWMLIERYLFFLLLLRKKKMLYHANFYNIHVIHRYIRKTIPNETPWFTNPLLVFLFEIQTTANVKKKKEIWKKCYRYFLKYFPIRIIKCKRTFLNTKQLRPQTSDFIVLKYALWYDRKKN